MFIQSWLEIGTNVVNVCKSCFDYITHTISVKLHGGFMLAHLVFCLPNSSIIVVVWSNITLIGSVLLLWCYSLISPLSALRMHVTRQSAVIGSNTMSVVIMAITNNDNMTLISLSLSLSHTHLHHYTHKESLNTHVTIIIIINCKTLVWCKHF